MTQITVQLPAERMARLQERAAQLGVSLEQLVQLSIEELLSQPDEQFQKAAEYVLQKNAELYRRLS